MEIVVFTEIMLKGNRLKVTGVLLENVVSARAE
jgi:hypothetical protein